MLIASLMIFVMGISMLKMDRGTLDSVVVVSRELTQSLLPSTAKAKWRLKLTRAFDGRSSKPIHLPFLLILVGTSC